MSVIWCSYYDSITIKKIRKVVSESYIMDAMVHTIQYLKLMVEPGGCVGLAAILAGLLDSREKTTLVILSGGNLSLDMLGKFSIDKPK